MAKFDLTKEDLKDIPKERLDKAWEVYDKYAHMIEIHNTIKTRTKSFIGGLVIGFTVGILITVSLYGNWVLKNLEKLGEDHALISFEVIRGNLNHLLDK